MKNLISKSMIEEQLLAIINGYSCTGYYKFGSIPAKKLEAAIQHYPVDPSDTVLALIDATIMGSAKIGMAIGLKGIYWANDWTVKTKKNFLSWDELSSNSCGISKSIYNVQLAAGCEFGMAGSSMKKELLVNLLNQIVTLYKQVSNEQSIPEVYMSIRQDVALIAQSSPNSLYSELIPQLIALCIVADGDIENSEIELAMTVIENDELIENKPVALEMLSTSIEKLLADRQKSSTIFKLKSTTIISKVAKINDILEKERLSIILDGMLETVSDPGVSETASIINAIKGKISM